MNDQKQLLTEIKIQNTLSKTLFEIDKIMNSIVRLNARAPQFTPRYVLKKDRTQIAKDIEKLQGNISQLKSSAIKEIDKLSEDLPKNEQEKAKQDARKSLGIDRGEKTNQPSFSSRFMREKILGNDNNSAIEKGKEEHLISSRFVRSIDMSKYQSKERGIPLKNQLKEIE